MSNKYLDLDKEMAKAFKDYQHDGVGQLSEAEVAALCQTDDGVYRPGMYAAKRSDILEQIVLNLKAANNKAMIRKLNNLK